MFTHLSSEDVAFVGAQCPQCEGPVLTWQDLDQNDQRLLRCLDCDTILVDTNPNHEEQLQAWTDKDLAREGYKLEGYKGDDTKGGCRGGNCGS